MIRQNKPSTPNTFHVLGENEAPESGPASRNKNDSAVKATPSISGANSARRTPTPSKQITLQHVKRRDDRDTSNEKVDIEEIRQSLSRENSEIFLTESKDAVRAKENKPTYKSHNCEEKPTKPPFVVRSNAGLKPFTSDGKPPPERSVQEKKETRVPGKNEGRKEESKKEEDKESSDDSSSEEEEEEKRRAPTQLLMEFLECLMQSDYPNASKLCKMILIYEPDHPEALKFQPVIEERLQLDKEAEEEGEDSDDDEGDDEDDSEDESDDDSGNSDSESDDEEEDDKNEDENQPNVLDHSSDDESKFDSGILSANSDG